jgi:hypothetical protein
MAGAASCESTTSLLLPTGAGTPVDLFLALCSGPRTLFPSGVLKFCASAHHFSNWRSTLRLASFLVLYGGTPWALSVWGRRGTWYVFSRLASCYAGRWDAAARFLNMRAGTALCVSLSLFALRFLGLAFRFWLAVKLLALERRRAPP